MLSESASRCIAKIRSELIAVGLCNEHIYKFWCIIRIFCILLVFKILDMNESELGHLARHLGHDPKTHQEFYRLSHSTVQLSKVNILCIVLYKKQRDKF